MVAWTERLEVEIEEKWLGLSSTRRSAMGSVGPLRTAVGWRGWERGKDQGGLDHGSMALLLTRWGRPASKEKKFEDEGRVELEHFVLNVSQISKVIGAELPSRINVDVWVWSSEEDSGLKIEMLDHNRMLKSCRIDEMLNGGISLAKWGQSSYW